ncbi:MAG: hypothetical protein U1E62_26620 [Alsobacter sp.]
MVTHLSFTSALDPARLRRIRNDAEDAQILARAAGDRHRAAYDASRRARDRIDEFASRIRLPYRLDEVRFRSETWYQGWPTDRSGALDVSRVDERDRPALRDLEKTWRDAMVEASDAEARYRDATARLEVARSLRQSAEAAFTRANRPAVPRED